jgi:nicotinamidase-related amidase
MSGAADGLADAALSQLIVIDIQEKLASVVPEPDRERCLANTARLLQTAALLDLPVTATEQYPHGLGPTHPRIATHLPAGTRVIDKTGFSCCAAQDYDATLAAHARAQVVVTGLEAHVCVLQTALQLHRQGYQVFLVEDAICARHAADQHNAVARMRSAGITVTCTESVLFEWLRDARHEHFKAVSALIKDRPRDG